MFPNSSSARRFVSVNIMRRVNNAFAVYYIVRASLGECRYICRCLKPWLITRYNCRRESKVHDIGGALWICLLREDFLLGRTRRFL